MHYTHPSPFINCIEINDSGHIFIGGNYTAYRSADNGATWTTLSGGITSEIKSIAFNDSGHIFAGNWQEYGSQSGILKSTDNGDTWTTVKLSFRVNSSHNIVINTNGDIIVGSWGWGIWKSTDNGDTWTQHNSGLGHLYIKSMHISNDGNIYAGISGGGIYRSDDGGESWQQVGLTAAGVKRIAISPLNGYIFTLVNGISRSTNNGQTWVPTNSGLISYDTRQLTIKNDGTIFCGLGDNDYGILYRSTNNGDSWQRSDNGLAKQTVSGMTYDSDGNVYVSIDNNGDTWFKIGDVPGGKIEFNSISDLFLASWGGGFWKLPAGDTVWVDLTTLVNANWIWSMLIGSNDYIYVGTKRSTDNGMTWGEIPQPGPYPCYAENSAGHIFMGTRSYGTGIWRSTDFGESWESINTGLPTLEIWSLGIDSEDYLYAGTDGYSMCKTTTPTVTSVDDDRYTPTSFSLEQNYPNPFNPSTKISWQSPVGSHQTLKVYDVLGNEVATLVNEYKPAGRYEIEFNVAQESIPAIASGVYFYQLRAGEFLSVKKMLLIK